MGKVIKGSTESQERYTLIVPNVVAPISSEFDLDAADDAWLGAPVAAELPVEPAVDLEALHAQAQEIVDDATRDAQAIIDDAQERSRALLDDAARQAQTIADDARRTARDDGYAAGVAEADAAMADMLAAMRTLIDVARTERHALLTSAEPELVRLALGIAERVLHQQVALDHGVVVEMAKAAISRIVDREKITVRVNPADIERMREHREELLTLGDVKTMQVVEDQRVDRGGVVLETDAGSIDAKISTQLAEVRKILHIADDIVVQVAGQQDDDADDRGVPVSRAS
jgi:flagellar assembly protein FliH